MTVIPAVSLQVPMEFENLRDAITALFKANEQGLYVTLDHQEQSRAASEFKDGLRTIQVFVQNSDPDDQTRTQFENEVTFGVFMRVAKAATGDKAVLSDPLGDPAAKMAALANIDTGAYRANLAYDELERIATRIIMSPLNEDLGMPEFTVDSRNMKTFRKDQAVDHGNLVTVTGSAFISARVTEIMDGATPVPLAGVTVKPDFKTQDDSEEANPAKLQVDIENP